MLATQAYCLSFLLQSQITRACCLFVASLQAGQRHMISCVSLSNSKHDSSIVMPTECLCLLRIASLLYTQQMHRVHRYESRSRMSTGNVNRTFLVLHSIAPGHNVADRATDGYLPTGRLAGRGTRAAPLSGIASMGAKIADANI